MSRETAPREILVFDMDGVLVDVSQSYRAAIRLTVEHFTGQRVSPERVQEYKNRGGFNNDFLLSQVIAKDLGVEVAYARVVDYFNQIFYGNIVDGIPDGLMAQERWVAADGLLEGLRRRYQLAIFTGREREEALMSLRRFAPQVPFFPLIATEDVQRGKPDPEGLLRIRELCPESELWFIGDSVDDARSARDAGVPFIGVAAPEVAQRGELLALFDEAGALAIIEDINQLPEILPNS